MQAIRVKEYFLTYRHINGKVIRKQLLEPDLDEVYSSPFVAEVLATTPIDFDNWRASLEAHNRKVRKTLS